MCLTVYKSTKSCVESHMLNNDLRVREETLGSLIYVRMGIKTQSRAHRLVGRRMRDRCLRSGPSPVQDVFCMSEEGVHSGIKQSAMKN